MKAKLVVEGKEFSVEINHSELQKLLALEKKTGYEKVGKGHTYSYVNTYGEIKTLEHQDFDDDKRYDDANYYSDRTIAENNARADKLMRQLRRFEVKHREGSILWNDVSQDKFAISFNYVDGEVYVSNAISSKVAFGIYFNDEEMAELAIEICHDELIWYFTEYKDSL